MLWKLSAAQWIMSFGFVCCLSYISGWLADGILKSAGFGHIGNWFIVLSGSYGAMYIFNTYGYTFKYDPIFTLGYISAGAGLFFLFMCVSKRIFIR